MVLIHGYGGTSSHLYRIYKKLSKEFNIYAIDIPGMGLSSHPAKFKIEKVED